jgi:hypothetical protein
LALKYGCKFVETSVAINDKVDDLLAGILKQIRLNETLMSSKELAVDVALSPNERQTSFIERKHVRNYSDAQLNDIIKKSPPTATPATNNTLSFRSNTLTRRFFKSSKNKENLVDTERPSQYATSKMSNTISSGGGGSTSGSGNNGNNSSNNNNNTLSFFHKIYSSIFKKKSSNPTQLQTVEDLFTLPIPVNRVNRKV